ncbi:hypothetical protein VT84_11225 [Gemmata sp. SH-PL17]|nr:hypothetical protein VT84_11225 [Gemmata sp. SH-PL17]
MIDWATLFNESHPEAGASDEIIAQFVASVLEPLSGEEIAVINRRQQNPFPKSDLLHATFRPFDPTHWVLPNPLLPASYLAFLRWSNGGAFRTGGREFGFFPALGSGCGVRAMMLGYELPEYMPGALPIAFNGGGTFYLLDMRKPARNGEYPIVCSHSGNLGWDADECVPIADSFPNACRGTVNVDELR